MKRRLISLCLTIAILAMACVPVLATETVTGKGGEVEVTLTAAVTDKNLKVTVPTAIAFSLDPSIEVTSHSSSDLSCTKQVTQADINVINDSPYPIYMGTLLNGVSDGIAFQNSIAMLNDSKTMMFELCIPCNSTGVDTSILNSYNFTVPRTASCGDLIYGSQGVAFSVNPYDGVIPKSTTAPLYVLCLAKNAALADVDGFTISVNFIVSNKPVYENPPA